MYSSKSCWYFCSLPSRASCKSSPLFRSLSLLEAEERDKSQNRQNNVRMETHKATRKSPPVSSSSMAGQTSFGGASRSDGFSIRSSGSSKSGGCSSMRSICERLVAGQQTGGRPSSSPDQRAAAGGVRPMMSRAEEVEPRSAVGCLFVLKMLGPLLLLFTSTFGCAATGCIGRCSSLVCGHDVALS